MSEEKTASPEGTGNVLGVDVPNVSAWLEENIPGMRAPFRFRLIAGGRSNLTFEVIDAEGGVCVLRRPPTGHVLPTAHDMAREFRIISAVRPAGIPVAPALGLCNDRDVNGAPFYVMGFVDGIIPRTQEDAERELSLDARGAAGLWIADTLARIHMVDPDAVGLGDLGRKDGYIARQLRRWYGNYQAARDARAGETVEDVDAVHDFLVERIPDQGPATIVHGDYRLDNCVLTREGRVIAVLDWELCTLGDPLADLGQLLVYWPQPGEASALGHAATTADGFPTRDQLVERYCETLGRDVGSLDYYKAFAYWKLACILEGVYTRYVLGAMGDDGFDVSSYPTNIAWLGAQARAATAGIAP